MATIRNLIVRISVTENTSKGIRKVTTSLRETNREIDQADKGSSRFGGTLSKLGRTSMTGLTRGLSAVAAGSKKAAVGILAVGAAAASLNTVVQAGGALAPLLGGLALLPAVAVSAAAAMGTLKLATSGTGDAFKAALAGDAGKLKDALKDLAPAARDTAKELFALRPTLLGIRNAAQQALFKPLVGQLTALAKTLGGPIKTGAAAVAAQFGIAGRKIAEFARQSKSVELVKAAFGQTQQAIKNIMPALDPLLKGFRALATEGLSFLPRIGTAIGTIGKRFGEWLQQMVKSGQATKWINNFFDTLTQLGGVLKSVGGILSSVFSAASAAGSGFLGVLGAALGKLNAFLKTAAGKSALVSIFQGLAAAGEALGPVIAALVTGLGTLAGPVGRLAQVLGPILTDAINALAPALAALEPGLRAVFAGLGAAVQVLAPVLPLIGQAISQIAVALAPVLPLVAQAVVALAPLLPLAAQLAALLAQQLSAALLELTAVLGPVITAIAGALVPIMPQITAAFALWAAALVPVAGLLGQQLGQALARVLPQFAAMIPQLLNGLVPAMIQLLVAITPLLPQIIELAVVIAENLAQALPQLLPALIELINLMVQWTPIMVPILSMILQISTALASNLGSSVNLVVGVIGAGLNAIFGLFRWLFDVLLGHSVIPDIVNGIIGWFGSLPSRVISIFSGLATGAINKVKSLLSYAKGIPKSIKSTFSGAGSFLYGAGQSIINGLVNGIKSMIGWLKSNLSWVTSLIPSWKGPMDVDRKLLTPSGAAIMGGLVTGITSQLPMLKHALGGVSSQIATTPLATPSTGPAGVRMAANAPAGVAAAGRSGGGTVRVWFDWGQGNGELKKVMQKIVRVDGGGDVQVALGGTS
jgi:phage-related protein